MIQAIEIADNLTEETQKTLRFYRDTFAEIQHAMNALQNEFFRVHDDTNIPAIKKLQKLTLGNLEKHRFLLTL